MVKQPLSATKDDHKHRRLIYQLGQAGGLRNLHLATLLDGCCPEQPCRSGTCILCGRRHQRAVFELIECEIREPTRQSVRGRMSLVTIVPSWACTSLHDLSAEHCCQVLSAISAAISAAGRSPAITCLDVSFNEDLHARFEPHWAIHGVSLFADWPSKREAACLRDAFPPSGLVKRPVDIAKLDQRDNGLLYAIKPDRFRRENYLNYKSDRGRAPFDDTRSRPLRPAQAVALAQVEHQLGFGKRLVITGIDQDAVRTALNGFFWPQDGP